MATSKRRASAREAAAEVLPGLVADWGGFERFVADLNRTAENVVVEHGAELADRAGVKRKLDVVVRYRFNFIEHIVIIECKFWKTNVKREKVDAFAQTVRELNASSGVMFSAVGFQSGAIETARANGISLFKVREPTSDEWGEPGRYVDVYVAVAAASIGPFKMPGYATPPIPNTNARLTLRAKGKNKTKTEGILRSGKRIILETLMEERAHEAARNMFQREMRKGLPFFPESGRRRVWHQVTLHFHPDPLQLVSQPNIFIQRIEFPVGLSIMQTRERIDRSEYYTFVVAVEDCITNAVTGAIRRLGDAFTTLFPMLPKQIDSSEAVQSGLTVTAWMRHIQSFTDFEGLAEGQLMDGELPVTPSGNNHHRP